MDPVRNKAFGAIITRLINKETLSFEEAHGAFCTLLNNETTDLQQGAFLAALCAKGESKEEVKGAWRAIFDLDTVKVEDDSGSWIENSGTGMDSFKTFNISTCASILAAACGAKMARHGARALSSKCGTVDMAELLGVDVECQPSLVAESIRQCGLGLFNGMSPQSHPNALGRVLSQIHFGSTLNISASLANPAMPRNAVRGVYSPAMVRPVAEIMQEIGYQRAIVLHGCIDHQDKGMDEASVCGTTECVELFEDGRLEYDSFRPEDFGLQNHQPEALAPEQNLEAATKGFVQTLKGQGSQARIDSVLLNTALILKVGGLSPDIQSGIQKAREAMQQGKGIESLKAWVQHQNRKPEQGCERLERILKSL